MEIGPAAREKEVLADDAAVVRDELRGMRGVDDFDTVDSRFDDLTEHLFANERGRVRKERESARRRDKRDRLARRHLVFLLVRGFAEPDIP